MLGLCNSCRKAARVLLLPLLHTQCRDSVQAERRLYWAPVWAMLAAHFRLALLGKICLSLLRCIALHVHSTATCADLTGARQLVWRADALASVCGACSAFGRCICVV
jgi:hypothetical protein